MYNKARFDDKASRIKGGSGPRNEDGGTKAVFDVGQHLSDRKKVEQSDKELHNDSDLGTELHFMGVLTFSYSSDHHLATDNIMPTAIEAAAPQKANKFVTELNPKGIKPYVQYSMGNPCAESRSDPLAFCRCCACPETKSARDDCFLKFGHSVEEDGESARKCEELVKRHRECMASLGYKI